MTSRPRGASCAVPWTTGSGTAHTVEKGPIMDTVNSMALGATAEVNEVTSGTLDGTPTSGSTETAGASGTTAMRTDDGERTSRSTRASTPRRATKRLQEGQRT